MVVSYYYTIAAIGMMVCVIIKEVIYDFFVAVFRKKEDQFDGTSQ